MKISQAFPGEWLKASDIGEKKIKVTIQTCHMHEFTGEGEKPIVTFKDKDRGLVLNKTNANILLAGLGDETDEWTDREIFLYSAKVNFQGNIVDGIRVEVIPEKPKPVAVEEDDVPF